MTACPYRRPGALLPVAGVFLIGALLSVWTVVPAHADVTADGRDSTGVGITPARVQVDLSGRVFDFEVTVFNDTDGERSITMAVVELGHTLDGAPVLGEPLDEVVQTSGESSFVLQSGESVDLGFSASFPDSVALYGAVLAQVGQQESAGGAIGVRTQVASLLLLRGPRPWDQSIEARGVGVEGDGDERRLYVDVTNVGNAHVRPAGTFVVSQAGQEIATVELPGENIIPGYGRRLYAPWTSEQGSDTTGQIELTVDLGEGVGLTDTIDLSGGTGSGSSESDAGGGSGAVFEGGSGAGQETFDGQRRVLLPLAGLLILLALGGLWMLVMWKRREHEDEAAEAAAANVSGGEDEGG